MCHPVKNLLCLTVWHISVLFWPPKGSRRCRTTLAGVVRQRLHSFSRHLKICRKAKRDWNNFKESLIRLGKKAPSALLTPVNMGILWQVQSLDKHGFLPAAQIKVVGLEVDGRDWLGGSFPHRQRMWQLRSEACRITALKISPAFDARHKAVIQSVPWLESAWIKPYHVLPLRTASQQAARMMKTLFSSGKTKDFNLLVSGFGDACQKRKTKTVRFLDCRERKVEGKKNNCGFSFFPLS